MRFSGIIFTTIHLQHDQQECLQDPHVVSPRHCSGNTHYGAVRCSVSLWGKSPVIHTRRAGPSSFGPDGIHVPRSARVASAGNTTGDSDRCRHGELRPGRQLRAVGDLCGTWPTAAQAAFDYAAGIWAEGYLNSSIPIVIQACWTDMGSPNILGHGGAVNLWYDSPPQSWAPVTNTFYPSALANALSGTDFDGPTTPEIAVAFNKTLSFGKSRAGSPAHE